MPTNPKPRHLECGIVHLDVPYKRFTSRSGILRTKMSWARYIVLLCVVLIASSGKTRKRRDSSPDRRNARITNTLKQDILSLMRMVRRPRPSMMARLNGRRLSAPVYMVKLYKSISQNQSYYDGFCCNGTIADWRAVGADTIMSYFNQVRKRPPKISRHHATFKFQVQSPTDEKVMAAEFRLYKERVSSPDKQSWKNATYMVRLYQIIYPARVLDLLETRVLRGWEAGWQAFDITKAGKVWSKKPSTNYGLELSVVNWLNQEVNPHRVGFVGFHGPLDKRPFLVSFFQHEGAYSLDSVSAENQTNQTSRSSRSLDSSSDDDGRTTSGAGSKRSGDAAGPNRGGQGGRGSRTGSNYGGSTRAGVGSSQRGRQNAWSKFCQRRFLHVTFRRLSWHSWIIAPEGYSAFFCHGECSFPLNANMNVTNHAIVQTVVHLMHPRLVPKPCCAPTKLSPISVLFYDDKNNVVLKKYSNMVVKECGCQ